MHKNLRRSVVALATAFACIGIMASPATATVDTYVITGGTLVAVSNGGANTINTTLGGTAGSGCTSTIQADVTGTTSGTVTVTTLTSVGHFTLGTHHYVATITRTSGTAGTWGTSTSGTISSLTVGVRVQIRTAPDDSSTNFDCTPAGTTVLCTLNSTVHLAGTYANGHLSTVSTTGHLATTAASTITLGIGTCAVPFSTFNGGTATISSMTIHQTA